MTIYTDIEDNYTAEVTEIAEGFKVVSRDDEGYFLSMTTCPTLEKATLLANDLTGNSPTRGPIWLPVG